MATTYRLEGATLSASQTVLNRSSLVPAGNSNVRPKDRSVSAHMGSLVRSI